ncbi:MAG: mechanosensitive ion channel family protein [Campylobacterales bacterium]|nr:mechanosensitive ion channel family protein [Campylobacterales bacterium]
MSNNEVNATQSLDVINTIDMNIATTVQSQLAPLYEKFPFFTHTFWNIPLANFIAAIIVFFFFLLLRKFLTSIVIGFLQKLASRTATLYDDKILLALKAPLSFAMILIGVHLFFTLIFKETQTIKHIINTLVVYDIFWGIVAVTEALRGLLYHATAKLNPDLSKEMGNFILTLLKILIAGIGLGTMMQVWGINVTALIASLGLGGLAFALAAKDTVANLFGSFSLLADKTIRIGEWIKVNDTEGIVEDIGMRTTKIRSFEKTLITIPNQIIANHPIENFSRRGVRRIKMSIGLNYSTGAAQMQAIVEQIRKMLQEHPHIAHKETLLVNFDSFGESALNIFVYTFTATADWEIYLQIREEIHLEIMKIVENNGSSFAFPSQSIYVEQMPGENML